MPTILEALQSGDRFPFPLLASHFEDCLAYWEWWWSQADPQQLSRPQIISDDDEMLQPTISTLFVDTLTYYHCFDKFLRLYLKNNFILRGEQISRQAYQESLIEHLFLQQSIRLEDRVIVFLGGGYGAGKTTIASFLANAEKLPLSLQQIVGVDSCKLFLPEFEAIRRLGDGRASSTVQEECRMLADRLYVKLLASGRSFIWDSSMSDITKTMEKIIAAKEKGYALELVAVGSSIESAISRAMVRAKVTRRFAHPAHFKSSHCRFARGFPEYFPHFSKIMLFWNEWVPGNVSADPKLIAQKRVGDNFLEYYADDSLSRFQALGTDLL